MTADKPKSDNSLLGCSFSISINYYLRELALVHDMQRVKIKNIVTHYELRCDSEPKSDNSLFIDPYF